MDEIDILAPILLISTSNRGPSAKSHQVNFG